MNDIKDALWAFLGCDAVLEWDYEGTTISGTSDTMFVTVRSPKSNTPDGKWHVCVYPRATVDAGYSDFVGTIEDTDVEVCNWFDDYELFIHDKVLEILATEFKKLITKLDDVYEDGRDRDLCDFDD